MTRRRIRKRRHLPLTDSELLAKVMRQMSHGAALTIGAMWRLGKREALEYEDALTRASRARSAVRPVPCVVTVDGVEVLRGSVQWKEVRGLRGERMAVIERHYRDGVSFAVKLDELYRRMAGHTPAEITINSGVVSCP